MPQNNAFFQVSVNSQMMQAINSKRQDQQRQGNPRYSPRLEGAGPGKFSKNKMK